MDTGPGSQETVGGPAFKPSEMSEIPVLPDARHLAARDTLVRKATDALVKHGIATLVGPSGVGKSTLAKQVAAADRDPWRVLGLRGVDAGATRLRLLNETGLMLSGSLAPSYIVDDVGPGSIFYEAAMVTFLATAARLGGRVIVTTYRSAIKRFVCLRRAG